MEITRRSMRPEEVRELGPLPSYHWRINGLGFGLFFGAAIAAAVGVRLQVIGIGDGRQLAAFIATFPIAASMLWLQQQRRIGAVYRKAALQNEADRLGEVEEWRLNIKDAIEVEEWSDLGSNYYLALEDGRVLFLS